MPLIACLLVIDSDDPRLDPTRLDASTHSKREGLRTAVLTALPDRIASIVAVMSEDEARLMISAHDIACREAGASPDVELVGNGRLH